ncbi:hypothetical protein D3C71_2159840 [compost metagenome]
MTLCCKEHAARVAHRCAFDRIINAICNFLHTPTINIAVHTTRSIDQFTQGQIASLANDGQFDYCVIAIP